VFFKQLQDPLDGEKAYTVICRCTGKPAGLVVIRSCFETTDSISFALFLPFRQGLHHAEVFYLLVRHTFETQDCDRVIVRAGILSDEHGSAPGYNNALTIDGVLRRQMLVAEQDPICDQYTLSRADWTGTKTVMEAWLGLKDSGVRVLEA
jgi:hypothetical protein